MPPQSELSRREFLKLGNLAKDSLPILISQLSDGLGPFLMGLGLGGLMDLTDGGIQLTPSTPRVPRTLASIALKGMLGCETPPATSKPEDLSPQDHITDPNLIYPLLAIIGSELSPGLQSIRDRIIFESGFRVNDPINILFTDMTAVPELHQTMLTQAQFAPIKGNIVIGNDNVPFGIFVNLTSYPDAPSGTIPRFVKTALTNNTAPLIGIGTENQREYIRYITTKFGIDPIILPENQMIYPTTIQFEGVDLPSHVMTYYGQTLRGSSMNGILGLSQQETLLQVGKDYNTALLEVIQFHEATGIPHIDPNLGNIAFKEINVDGRIIRVPLWLDWTNKSVDSQQPAYRNMRAWILGKAQVQARAYKLPGIPQNLQELDALIAARTNYPDDIILQIEAVMTTPPKSIPTIITDGPGGQIIGVEGIDDISPGTSSIQALDETTSQMATVDITNMTIAQTVTEVTEVGSKTKIQLMLSNFLESRGGRMIIRFAPQLGKGILAALDYVGLMGTLMIIHQTFDGRYIKSVIAVENDGYLTIPGTNNIDDLWAALMSHRVTTITDNLPFIEGAREDMNQIIAETEPLLGLDYVSLETRVRQEYIKHLLQTTSYGSMNLDVNLDEDIINHSTQIEMIATGDAENPVIHINRIKKDESGKPISFAPIGIYVKQGGKWNMPEIGLDTSFAVYRTQTEALSGNTNEYIQLMPPEGDIMKFKRITKNGASDMQNLKV